MASSPSSDMLTPIVIAQDICKQKCVHIVTVNKMEEFEDTKGVIRIRISKKKRQHKGQTTIYNKCIEYIRKCC